MNKEITKAEYIKAENSLEKLVSIINNKGGFEFLTEKGKKSLAHYTAIIKEYEDVHFHIPMPGTLQGLLELKMYEKKLKQKELAALLNTTDTKLSEIMHHKRKPSLSFIKALNHVLGIDGNLLLKVS